MLIANCFVIIASGCMSPICYFIVFEIHIISVVYSSLVPRLSWEGKESLITTACACAKVSVFYPRAIRGLLDHMIMHTMPAQAQKLPKHNKMVVRRAKKSTYVQVTLLKSSRHHHQPMTISISSEKQLTMFCW